MHRALLLPVLLTLGGLALAADPHDHGASHTASSDPSTHHAGEEHAGDLRTIMLALGEELAHAQQALWREDLATVAKAARAVADHPHVSPTEMARVQAALGADFGAFVAADKATHDASVTLAEVAAQGDPQATVQALGAVQAGCVSCHQQFRTRLQR